MADRSSPTASTMEVKSFRLILSDPQTEHGQKVKTCNLNPGDIEAMTIDSVVVRLNEHFDFAQVIAERNLSLEALTAGAGGHVLGNMALLGTDGSRHVPIRTNEQLVTFFKSVSNSKLPSLEVKLSQPGSLHKAAASQASSSVRRKPDDSVEELEDENFRTTEASQKLQQAVQDLERTVANDREEAQRLVNMCSQELGSKMDSNQQTFTEESKALRETAEGVRVDGETIKKSLKEFEKKSVERHDKVQQQLQELNVSINRRFEDVQSELGDLKQADDELRGDQERVDAGLLRHAAELQRVESTRVATADWKAAEDALSKRVAGELAELRRSLTGTETDLRSCMDKQRADVEERNKTFIAEVKGTTGRLDAAMKELDAHEKTGIQQVVKDLEKSKQDLQNMLTTEISNLNAVTDQRMAEVTKTEKALSSDLTEIVTELRAKTEATFVALETRFDSLVKAERSRLGNIERDLSEGSAKLRSDCRAEVERVRVDYEQEAARLDADLSDLHMKHDVVKQEINFFQSRLLEQRDWAQRQLSETATATRAAQVDAQEGVAAATKMAHTLRDDQVSFRDKMAKHISLLQHSSDSYGDAINALETQRSRMRLELDAVLADHKAYVTDMDGWADDVRVKVERLFRAMEAARCEWRINSAVTKIKDLKKPLALRSPGFALQGLRNVQLELYPHGTNQSPDGKAVIRISMPPNANVRYQCWLGKISEGSREYESGGSLSVDLEFDTWKDQVLEDGGLVISLEVLQDLTNNDESLARAVHLEDERHERN